MRQHLASLYRRYAAHHLDLVLPGCAIRDVEGRTLGYVDSLRWRAGQVQVTGWAQAARLRLALADSSVEEAPTLRRDDVAGALGVSPTLGFVLTVPAPFEAVAGRARPELLVTPESGAAAVAPLRLPLRVPLPVAARLRLAFLRDLARALPALAGWLASRDPAHRARIKERLRLGLLPARGVIDAGQMPLDAAAPRPDPGARIDIVLPVHNAFEVLQECLARVERHTELPWRLIVIEDGSTDPRVRPFLRGYAEGRAQVVVLENAGNLGFIASVNRGLEHAAEAPDGGAVVLLNSDALVPERWAGRLVAPLADPRVASVTPMSNDAEIFSVPLICTRAALGPGQGDAIDAVARRIPWGVTVPAPTGVGFCMALARDWLARVPALDPAFGRGYGEEVDWCRKVAAMGAVHLGLPGLFVEHRGGESFGSEEKRALVARNNAVIARRYPGYDQSVQDFIAADPALTARLALGLAWAGSLDPGRGVPVYLAHAMGGGADKWLEARIAGDRAAVVLRVGGARRWQLELVTPAGRIAGVTEEAETVARLLALLPRRRLVYSCGVGDRDPVEIPGLLAGWMQPGDSAEMLFHDYFPLSPSYTLLDSDGAYRGPVGTPRADPAHRARRPDGTLVSLGAWQAAWRVFAARADLVVFSEDSARQVAAVWPDLAGRIVRRAHGLTHAIPLLPAPAPHAPPVLAVLGNIGPQKGAAIVQRLARRRAADGSGPGLVLIGTIDPAYALPSSIRVHGGYRLEHLPDLVRRYGITHWLIPSVWPETFCFTVHEALATGLPVLAFGLGAQGAAVRAAPNGIEMPFALDVDLAETVRAHMARGAMAGGDAVLEQTPPVRPTRFRSARKLAAGARKTREETG